MSTILDKVVEQANEFILIYNSNLPDDQIAYLLEDGVNFKELSDFLGLDLEDGDVDLAYSQITKDIDKWTELQSMLNGEVDETKTIDWWVNRNP